MATYGTPIDRTKVTFAQAMKTCNLIGGFIGSIVISHSISVCVDRTTNTLATHTIGSSLIPILPGNETIRKTQVGMTLLLISCIHDY